MLASEIKQGVIAPGAVVGDVDALLALGVGADEGAVGVDDRLVEELGGLLGPDAQAGLVDGVHQVQDVGLAEAAAEVARRWWGRGCARRPGR